MTKIIGSYAGIGSRYTPREIRDQMVYAASQLKEMGLILRSGGADGADMAFERGVPEPELKEIYLPWRGFMGNPSPRYGASQEALDFASEYHPTWHNLSDVVKSFMGRNSYQVMGQYLNDPVLFVLCWTHLGQGSGGTGQAIRIAKHQNIPVLDLGKVSLDDAADQINQITMKYT